jgi:hypothetical protein
MAEPTEREWLEGLRPEDEWDYFHDEDNDTPAASPVQEESDE